MRVHILTLFPEMFSSPFDYSIVKRARDKSLVEINIYNLRDFARDKYKSVDDRPYGGGAGMVLRVDVVDRALTYVKSKIEKDSELAESEPDKSRVVLLDARGERFNQKKAAKLSLINDLILIAGHYEGIDHRVHENLVDEVLSVGDFVLSGGEIPAMVVVDTVARLIPGVLGNPESLVDESFNEVEAVEYPQYTRPEEYNSWKVPTILLSGDHKKISEWRNSK